ncbi:Hpt domain-containing protein, partial [Marivita sp.]|uniref:Hpt domain-containing protein n=1 Tax=Marivita sp. TaxID=2003365 RepID=UPI0025B8783D
ISETMELDELEAWLQACLDEIRQALDAAARDRPGSIQAVHKAAGTAAFIGLPRLQSALNQMEAAQADADPFASALLDASDVFRKIRLDLSGV